MKKLTLFLFFACLLSSTTKAQLMAAKMIGKDASKYGIGYGLFTFLDIPIITDNQSIRIELMDLALFATKGENLFTTKKDGKGYISVKLGYKYVFSETNAGFYVIPSAGYCRTIFTKEGEEEATHGDGYAAALEGGYALAVGQKGHTVNLGLKYEYDHGNSTHILQSVGLRLSYSFGLLRKKDDY